MESTVVRCFVVVWSVFHNGRAYDLDKNIGHDTFPFVTQKLLFFPRNTWQCLMNERNEKVRIIRRTWSDSAIFLLPLAWKRGWFTLAGMPARVEYEKGGISIPKICMNTIKQPVSTFPVVLRARRATISAMGRWQWSTLWSDDVWSVLV